jgi:predicted nucleic acid-binding protein
VVTLIDSSVLIAVERGQLDFENIELGTEADLAISTVAAAEVLHGIHRAANQQRRLQRELIVEGYLARVLVLPFDMAAARVHARISAELASVGMTVGAHDLLIAATAISVGGRVATRDLRSFPKIPGLEILAC